MENNINDIARYASPACYAHELEFGEDGFTAVDPVAATDVSRWRRAERERLISARLAVAADDAGRLTRDVIAEIEQWVVAGPGLRISVYWPWRGELDLREEMRSWHVAGARVALPVVVDKHGPMVFREWHPNCEMERGALNIPVPAKAVEITPNVIIAPLVGFDRHCYRLGYGGGFFDRTLAALRPRPFLIGVGHPVLQIPTIYPQPHDVPMDVIITGYDRIIEREGDQPA
ncbi:MAG: 5-formyltetrahydrofolate cyclo-ligase, partial [Gammaproteobacteria bacterium]|nr:5-formyltetrahydrofolate cyclo-ligase [Gammaproteobacteria bacterium]